MNRRRFLGLLAAFPFAIRSHQGIEKVEPKPGPIRYNITINNSPMTPTDLRQMHHEIAKFWPQ